MHRNSILVKTISLCLIVTLLLIPISSVAQQREGTYAQGKMAGERDAKGNALWLLAGVGCGLIGVGAAYFSKPTPPAHALIGKSSEYVLGYTEGYQNKARNANTGYACGGWAAFIGIYAATGGFSTTE